MSYIFPKDLAHLKIWLELCHLNVDEFTGEKQVLYCTNVLIKKKIRPNKYEGLHSALLECQSTILKKRIPPRTWMSAIQEIRGNKKRPEKLVHVYTDGSCNPNPGPGGWSFIIQESKWTSYQEFYGGEVNTSNNRMEMTAIIKALQHFDDRQDLGIILTTDSMYVRDGITQWILKWKQRGWKTATGRPVKNKDLWMEIDALVHRHYVDFEWTKGHAGHTMNERCDVLANLGRMGLDG